MSMRTKNLKRALQALLYIYCIKLQIIKIWSYYYF